MFQYSPSQITEVSQPARSYHGLWPGEEVRDNQICHDQGQQKICIVSSKNQYGFIIKDEMEKTLKGMVWKYTT